MFEYKIKISDSFVEWVFELDGSKDYSIQDLIDVIEENTQLFVFKKYRTEDHQNKGGEFQASRSKSNL